MKCITRHTSYLSRSESFKLLCIGDVHLGNLHCNEQLLKALAKRLAVEPNTYWIGLGDYAEFINLHDKRFDANDLVSWLFGREELADIGRAEAARFLSIMQPVAGKCLALCEGNHEETIQKQSESDVYSIIVEGLCDKGHEHRLEHRGMVNWIFHRGENKMKGSAWACRIFATHGSGGGQSGGASGNRLLRMAEQVDGVDVILMGHLHTPDYKPLAKFRPGRGGEAEMAMVHAVSIPSLCTDMRYAESKDMRAVPTGFTELTLWPNEKRIEVATNVC